MTIFNDCPIFEDGVERVATKRIGQAKKDMGNRTFPCPVYISASKRSTTRLQRQTGEEEQLKVKM